MSPSFLFLAGPGEGGRHRVEWQVTATLSQLLFVGQECVGTLALCCHIIWVFQGNLDIWIFMWNPLSLKY